MKRLILLLFCLLTLRAFANGLPTTPYIYVQGAAEERVDPDQATIAFNLSTVDRDQARAKAAVSEKSAAVFKLLKELAIPDSDLTAHAISVNENYEFSSGKREFNGYTVTRSFVVRLKKLDLYPQLVNGLVELRVESLDNAQPGFSKTSEHTAALKKAALAEARRQAEDIAAGMDARVTGVFAVSPIPFGDIPQVIFGGGGNTQALALNAFTMRAAKDGAEDKYVFDKLTLTERLHAIFLIEPRQK